MQLFLITPSLNENGLGTIREYYDNFIKELPGASHALLPPRVTVNSHNIHQGVLAIVKAYRTLDQSDDNPFPLLEKCENYSTIHDTTTYWVKQLNTIIRTVKGDGTFVKVPFNMKQVTGSLTGENLQWRN